MNPSEGGNYPLTGKSPAVPERNYLQESSYAANPSIIEASGIIVRASWGHIYGPVDLAVQAGGVTVLVGPDGRGRTALLLTLAGRMKPTSGSLTGFGRLNDARYLFDRAGIADIDEIDGIGQTIRVADVVTEQIRWGAHWYRWVRTATEDDLERLCRPVFGEHPLPPMDAEAQFRREPTQLGVD